MSKKNTIYTHRLLHLLHLVNVTGVASDTVFCRCCHLSASQFAVLCIKPKYAKEQRCSSALQQVVVCVAVAFISAQSSLAISKSILFLFLFKSILYIILNILTFIFNVSNNFKKTFIYNSVFWVQFGTHCPAPLLPGSEN